MYVILENPESFEPGINDLEIPEPVLAQHYANMGLVEHYQELGLDNDSLLPVFISDYQKLTR